MQTFYTRNVESNIQNHLKKFPCVSQTKLRINVSDKGVKVVKPTHSSVVTNIEKPYPIGGNIRVIQPRLITEVLDLSTKKNVAKYCNTGYTSPCAENIQFLKF